MRSHDEDRGMTARSLTHSTTQAWWSHAA